MENKTCTMCKEEKRVDNFSPQRKVCKSCRSARNKYYRLRTEEQREKDIKQRQEFLNVQHLELQRRKSQPYACECGGTYLMYDKCTKMRHEQTKKHQNFVNGVITKRKWYITYYDETDNYEPCRVIVDRTIYEQFNDRRTYRGEGKSFKGSNYKLLKEMNIL